MIRLWDIAPNDPDMTAAKAGIYQAEGKLEQAARLLSEITWQTRSEGSFTIKIAQLRLERNYAEAIRLLQARLAQFQFESPYDRAGEQLHLAFMQRVAGDTSGAKVTGEEARSTIEDRYRGQPQEELVARMSQAYAATEEKDLALNVAQRAIVFALAAKDRMQGLALTRTSRSLRRSSARLAVPSPFSPSCYKPPIRAGFTPLSPLHAPFLGSIRSGILCAAIPLSKNCARKSSRD
jgi:hypothetical protein